MSEAETAVPKSEPPMEAAAPDSVVDKQPAAEPEMTATKRSGFSFSPKACCGCFFKKKSAPATDGAEGAEESVPRAEEEAPDAPPATTAPAS